MISNNLLIHRCDIEKVNISIGEDGEEVITYEQLYSKIPCNLQPKSGGLDIKPEGTYWVLRYKLYTNYLENIAGKEGLVRITNVYDKDDNVIFDGRDYKVFFVKNPVGMMEHLEFDLYQIHQG